LNRANVEDTQHPAAGESLHAPRTASAVTLIRDEAALRGLYPAKVVEMTGKGGAPPIPVNLSEIKATVLKESRAQRAGQRVQGQAELLQIVLALAAGGGLAHLLDRRDQEADEDGDDGYDHQ
jgi:hypothetical protein